MVRFMEGAWKTAWNGKMALVEGDWARFGSLMNENHRLVDDMMVYCGFPEGAGGVNNKLIDRALQGGALGAKLTGAGGGGCVFAVAYPGEQARVVEAWQSAISELELSSAQIYQPRIATQGLAVQVK
jgi:mevalonate kinase